MDILRLENLSKYYTSQSSVVVGLTGISLSFGIGEFVAVTGESGSGKSTLAHVLGGIIPYESGELYIHGEPTSHYDSTDWERYRRDMIGFISQSYGILAGNTVLDNVISTLRFYGVEDEQARERASEILKEVELDELALRKAGKLSSGQKQRLSIARALAKPSKILIADEPTGNLDKENSRKVVELLARASQDRLVIIITHEFSEVADLATRRITLADGALVTDAPLTAKKKHSCDESKPPERIKRKRAAALAPYVTGLTFRSHPVFSLILCILLAATTFITFVLLGTFTVALDDTTTRIYSSDAFYNGDSERIVVMRADGEPMSEEDYAKLLSITHAENIEKYGYANDINYYYRDEVDYRIKRVIVNGPNYHVLLNPDDFHIIESPEFLSNDSYIRSVPTTKKPISVTGELPTSTYEILSSDPNHKIGDRVKVYMRNRKEWSISYYVCMTFTVVGTTEYGDGGLYFSDKFTAMISETMDYARKVETPSWQSPVVLAPYDKDAIRLTAYLDSDTGKKVTEITEDLQINFTITDRDFITPSFNTSASDNIGEYSNFRGTNGVGYTRLCTACTDFNYMSLYIVSEAVFDEYIDTTPQNQVSLYIEDYAYTDRTLDALAGLGYLAVSPFRLGATQIDNALSVERYITLGICAVAFLLIFILEIILIKAMFSSLHEYFRLMSNIGLVSRTAYLSLILTMLICTAVGELAGGAAIAAMNYAGVARVVSIFKFLEPHVIALLFIVNTLCIAIAALSVLRSLKKTVFSGAARRYDINFAEMEDA